MNFMIINCHTANRGDEAAVHALVYDVPGSNDYSRDEGTNSLLLLFYTLIFIFISLFCGFGILFQIKR